MCTSILQWFEGANHEIRVLFVMNQIMIAVSHHSLQFRLHLSNYELTSIIRIGSSYMSTDCNITINSIIVCINSKITIKRAIFFNVFDNSTNKIVSEAALSCLTYFIILIFTYWELAFFFSFILFFYSWTM